MFRKQVSPKTVAIATLLILGAIQGVYWRLLVYRPPATGPMGGGGGGGSSTLTYLGREDVMVESIGGGGPGFRDGPIWQAQLNGPNALAADSDGGLLIVDSRNHRIRRLDRKGQISTLAGGGAAGDMGGRADGPALEARFRFPSGVAVGDGGTVYIADTGNHRICRLAGGMVSTLAGLAEGKADGPGTSAKFHYPGPMVWDAGALWVGDLGNRAIRRVGADGTVSSPVEVLSQVRAALGDVALPAAQVAITACPEGKGLPEPVGLVLGRRTPAALLSGGRKIFADPENHVIMFQHESDPPMLLAGRRAEGFVISGMTDGIGGRASFATPCATAVGPDGALYVSDYEGNRIRRLVLPAWMNEGQAPPEQVRRRWRSNRGS